MRIKKVRKPLNRKFKEAMLVSPAGQVDNRKNIREWEETDDPLYGYGEDDIVPEPVFNGDQLKTSTSEYRNIPHYEVNFADTGLDDDGILYIDPETDGTNITVTRIDAEGHYTNYILDLSGDVPTFYSSLGEKRNRIANKKNLKEGNRRFVNEYDKTLGKYLVARKDSLNKCKTKDDLIILVSGAYDRGNDNYVDTVIDNIKKKSSFNSAFQYVYNILLAGFGERAI